MVGLVERVRGLEEAKASGKLLRGARVDVARSC